MSGPVTSCRVVRVDLGPRGYDVVIGRGARRQLPSFVPAGARRAAVVTQAGIGAGVDPGIDHEVIEIPSGEAAKCMGTVEEIGRRLAEMRLSRSDVVVAVGGGLVTDVAGFAASIWHRGTPVIHVATTLLGQVDAAIGGKTGVNLPEGKNLLGTFWQPLAVICDTETLDSLPPEEWRSGWGEMAKYAFIGVPSLVELPLEAQVEACVALKARVVCDDERESSGARMILNYGHTLAHALEAAGVGGPGTAGSAGGGAGVRLRHGEAVAVGLVFAARLARALGRIGDDRVAEHEEVVASYQLPRTIPRGTDLAQLVELMARDKKAHGELTFVLDGPDGVEPVAGVPPPLVKEVLTTLEDRGSELP